MNYWRLFDILSGAGTLMVAGAVLMLIGQTAYELATKPKQFDERKDDLVAIAVLTLVVIGPTLMGLHMLGVHALPEPQMIWKVLLVMTSGTVGLFGFSLCWAYLLNHDEIRVGLPKHAHLAFILLSVGVFGMPRTIYVAFHALDPGDKEEIAAAEARQAAAVQTAKLKSLIIESANKDPRLTQLLDENSIAVTDNEIVLTVYGTTDEQCAALNALGTRLRNKTRHRVTIVTKVR